MLKFGFENKSYKSGNVSATPSNCTIQDEYNGKQDVLKLSANSYVAFPEAKIEYNDKKYRICISFYIETSARDQMTLLTGTAIPLSVCLKKSKSGAYQIEAAVTVNGAVRSAISKKTIAAGQWYTFEFVLLDGEFFFTVDDEAYGRRCFAGTPVLTGSTAKTSLYLGASKTAGNGFVGYIDSILFSDTPTAENLQTANALAAAGFMEADGKVQELNAASVVTGALISENNLFTPESNCFYNVYANGVIVWSPDYKCVWMTSKIFNKYLSLMKTTMTGMPIEDVVFETNKISYVLIDGGVLYDVPDVADVIYISGAMFGEYARAKNGTDDYGCPTSDLIHVNAADADDAFDYMNFTKAVMVCFKSSGAFRMEFDVAENYLSSYSSYGPVIQFHEGYQASGTRYTYWHCKYKTKCIKYSDARIDFIPMDNEIFEKFMEVNGVNKEEGFGKFLYPLGRSAVRNKDLTECVYQNFAGGVICKTYRTVVEDNRSRYKLLDVRAISTVRITLNEIIAHGDINDYGKRDAELYIQVYVGRNVQYNIENGKRWPDYSSRKNGGTNFKIEYSGKAVDAEHRNGENVYYDIPAVQGEDTIYFHVRVYDYDPVSDNDYLGSYTLDLDLMSSFGMRDSLVAENAMEAFENAENEESYGAIYHNIHLMDEGNDNRHGHSNVTLSFRIQSCIRDVNIDDYFRRYAYWSVDNFGAKRYKQDEQGKKILDDEGNFTYENITLERNMYNAVFNATSGNWYDWITSFWDSTWYYLVRDNFGGEGGLCFGFSTAALESIHGCGRYPIPLDDWMESAKYSSTSEMKSDHRCADDIKPAFFTMVRQKHIYQAGWAHVKHIVNYLCGGIFLNPPSAFREIIRILKNDQYCMVNLLSPGGHTVLAYKYDEAKNIIYVADSNHPWINDYNKDDAEAAHDHSYIKLSSGVINKVELYAADATEAVSSRIKTYSYCYPTPYAIVAQLPRVPSWHEALGNLTLWLLRIVDFAINNTIHCIIMFATGDAEIKSESDTALASKSYSIPVSGAQETITTFAGGLQMKVFFARDHFNITAKGTGTGSYSQYLFTRNKTIRIAAETNENEFDTISVSGLATGSPAVTTSSKKINSIQQGNVAVTPGSTSFTAVPAEEPIDKKFDISIETMVQRYGSKAGVYQPQRYIKPTSSETALPKKKYYVNTNAQNNGDHEMHVEGCSCMPLAKNCYALGAFTNEFEALYQAKKFFSHVNGCAKCCKQTNTG